MPEEKEAKGPYPLVLVFHIDREMIVNSELIRPFVDAVNHTIKSRDLNMVAFFMPTDTEERIECINPIIAPPEEMERIKNLVDALSTQFNVGGKIDEDEEEKII